MWKWLERLAGTPTPTDHRSAELYAEIVELARREDWYTEGGVADDIDGRFDMIVLMLSLYIVRLERDEADPEARGMTTSLIERFVADVDGSFREIGIGDMVIGKHMGRALQALGGRLGAYRTALEGGTAADLRGALMRNVYKAEIADDALDWTEKAVWTEWSKITARRLEELTH